MFFFPWGILLPSQLLGSVMWRLGQPEMEGGLCVDLALDLNLNSARRDCVMFGRSLNLSGPQCSRL